MNINFSNFKLPKDLLWKLIVEGETEGCLYFFFPLMAAQIDFSKEIHFLGQEFFKLFPELKNDAQNRRLDKLIQVTMKTGEVRWLLIHVEIQGYVDKEFTKRMFEYFYRILERYQMPVTALAIFTDDDPNFHPTEHKISCWGTEMTYRFNTYKLSEKTLEDFQDKDNVFSIIMETAWHNLKKNRPDDTALADLKLQIIRRFLEMGYPKERIRKILIFIGFYINFEDKSLTANFTKEMDDVIYDREMTINDVIMDQLGDQIMDQLGDQIIASINDDNSDSKLINRIREELLEGVKQEAKEEVKQEVKEEVKQEVKTETMRGNVSKLKEYGFTPQQISEMLEIPLEEVQNLLAISDDYTSLG